MSLLSREPFRIGSRISGSIRSNASSVGANTVYGPGPSSVAATPVDRRRPVNRVKFPNAGVSSKGMPVSVNARTSMMFPAGSDEEREERGVAPAPIPPPTAVVPVWFSVWFSASTVGVTSSAPAPRAGLTMVGGTIFQTLPVLVEASGPPTSLVSTYMSRSASSPNPRRNMPRVSLFCAVAFTIWACHMALSSGVRPAAVGGSAPSAHPAGGVAARRVPFPTVRLSLQ
ncbi:MAG: hypothetical protein BWX50_00840 [Euryarchaeota archaeon ADurb.Bin009]|nr:MAG: hypothetical protein BWX50_00840 [Euryarchaeota archaeon ADurb.Bin009]